MAERLVVVYECPCGRTSQWVVYVPDDFRLCPGCRYGVRLIWDRRVGELSLVYREGDWTVLLGEDAHVRPASVRALLVRDGGGEAEAYPAGAVRSLAPSLDDGKPTKTFFGGG